jgi:hypothetical protein
LTLFGFDETKNMETPTMKETLREVRLASQKRDQYQAIKSMARQWYSIKFFPRLFTFLYQEINSSTINYSKIIQRFNGILESEHKKENPKTNSTNLPFERVYTREERQERIKRYLSKKKNRKKKYFIRYEIRKTLANNRLRKKGKFIKNQKIDINKLIALVKAGNRNIF